MIRTVLLAVTLALALTTVPGKHAQAQDTVIGFSPPVKYVSPGTPSFAVDVRVEDVVTRDPCPWDQSGPCGLGAYKFVVSFDPTVIEWVSSTNGPFLTSSGRAIQSCGNSPEHDPLNGILGYQCTTRGATPLGPVGSGVLATLTFVPLVEGSTSLVFQYTVLAEIDGTSIGHTSQNGSVVVAPHADLQLSKTAPATVTAPGNITYGLQVTNLGPNEAQAVTLVDTLSSNVAFVTASPGCTYDSGQHKVTCASGNLGPSLSASASITVSVAANKAGRTISNLAGASSATLDPNALNNQAQTSTTVDLANVDITKSAPAQIAKAANGQYQITVTSTGPSGAGNVRVSDILSPDVIYVGSSATQGGCVHMVSPVPTVYCTLGDMAVSTSATVTITVTFPDLDKYMCNKATAQWTQVPAGTKESEPACTAVGLPDADGDGCSNTAEMGSDLAKGGGRDPSNPYDFYDVPVPAVADPEPNGPRNKMADIGDVLAVLLYAFADDNGPPNAAGVDYDSLKDGDWAGPTTMLPDGAVDSYDEVGRQYDRSPASPVSGPPNGSIDISDVLAALEQFGHDCSQPS